MASRRFARAPPFVISISNHNNNRILVACLFFSLASFIKLPVSLVRFSFILPACYYSCTLSLHRRCIFFGSFVCGKFIMAYAHRMCAAAITIFTLWSAYLFVCATHSSAKHGPALNHSMPRYRPENEDFDLFNCDLSRRELKYVLHNLPVFHAILLPKSGHSVKARAPAKRDNFERINKCSVVRNEMQWTQSCREQNRKSQRTDLKQPENNLKWQEKSLKWPANRLKEQFGQRSIRNGQEIGRSIILRRVR